MNHEEFKYAYKKEKDPRVVKRMLAVRMVCIQGFNMEEAAENLMHCSKWVSKWVQRYREGGIDALRDLPRSGRPPKVNSKNIAKVMEEVQHERTMPTIVHNKIHDMFGVSFDMSYIRQLMHDYCITPKVAQQIHINHASIASVNSWQYRLPDRLSRLEADGFVTILMDEAIFIHDSKVGRKYWSLMGTRINIPYTGGHKRIVVFGALTSDGRQMFRTYDKFNKYTYLEFVKEMRSRFGKITIMCDRAPQHTSKFIKEFMKENKDVKTIYLPKGSPYLSAVESCWKMGKHHLLVAEHYNKFIDLHNKISEYYRTTRFNMNLYSYMFRSASKFLTSIIQ